MNTAGHRAKDGRCDRPSSVSPASATSARSGVSAHIKLLPLLALMLLCAFVRAQPAAPMQAPRLKPLPSFQIFGVSPQDEIEAKRKPYDIEANYKAIEQFREEQKSGVRRSALFTGRS